MGIIDRFYFQTQESKMRIALLGKRLSSFDPSELNGYHAITFYSQICGRLTSINSSLQISGDLATKWTISEDGTKYAFTLDKNRL
ncbi:hypothetical protein OAQ84_00910 [Bdellovibrionales bacterium]|nr:hypothetical protein [Bdellovibrionales bacterium]